MIKVLISYKNGQIWKTSFNCPFEFDAFYDENKDLINSIKVV